MVFFAKDRRFYIKSHAQIACSRLVPLTAGKIGKFRTPSKPPSFKDTVPLARSRFDNENKPSLFSQFCTVPQEKFQLYYMSVYSSCGQFL